MKKSHLARRIETNANATPLTSLADLIPSGEEAPASETDVRPLWKLGRVVLRREKAHRGGKTVIVIDQFATHLPASVLEATAKKIRIACGCGSVVKERTIEVQGDQTSRVRTLLEREGYQVGGVS